MKDYQREEAENFDFFEEDADLEALARFLDARFSLFGVKFGFDSLIGLIPGIGDVASALIGLYIIGRAIREGASLFVIVGMFWNWVLDLVLGAVPLLGDFFDIAFRSNLKNVRSLQRQLKRKAEKARRNQAAS